MFWGKTVTFVEFPEKRQAMGCPSRGPLRGDNLKGKTRARGTVREDKRQVFPPRMRKQKDTPHLRKHLLPEYPNVRCLRPFTWVLDANRNPLIPYPILPPPSFLEVPPPACEI